MKKKGEEGNSSYITLSNVSFGYKKEESILKEISLSIDKGEIIGIVGSSGSGKTTLCYLLKGIIPHAIKGYLKGEVIIGGIKVFKTSLSRLARVVGMVFQDLNAQLFNNTVLEEIQFGLRNLKLDLGKAKEIIEALDLEDLASQIPMNLSAGQKQRVILASILALEPQVLILDEPAVHLDINNKKTLRSFLEKLNKEKGITILIASNDPWLIGHLAKRLILVKDGTASLIPKEAYMYKGECWKWKDGIF